MWECGLKHNLFYAVTTDLDVTPYVGVWIETFKTRSLVSITLSLLMWECGLKHEITEHYMYWNKSLLMWECGLKLSRSKS